MLRCITHFPTRYVRTHPIGRPTIRNPAIVDNKYLYDRVSKSHFRRSPRVHVIQLTRVRPLFQIVKGKIRDLIVNGPDTKTNNHYTYQGNLVATNGGGGGYGGGGNSHHHLQRTGYQGGFIADDKARDDTASSRLTIEKFGLSNAITSQ